MALHVNYEIRWKNYKAFEDTGWLTVKPLTVLIGANNSGKSSITAPLLLMSQTMSSRDALTPLVTRGPLLDAGIFKDIIHKHDTSKSLFLGLRYHVHDPKSKIKPVGAYPPGAAEITLTAGDRPEDIILSEFQLCDIYRRPFLHQLRQTDGSYSIDGKFLEYKKSNLKKREFEAITSTEPINFMFSPAAILNAYRQDTGANEDRPSLSDYSSSFQIYLSAISIAFEELREIFRDLSYIGPLRDRPRRYYEISGETPVSVGARGENMANLVRRRHSELKRKLNNWIQRFEFGSRLRVNSLSTESFSLSFESNKNSTTTNIAAAGFGASQVLPLIVQALTATTDSLTIAEQPEIHLNPRLQCLLADLFVEMATAGRRVIVETHSEHLLLRLRRLISMKKIDSNDVALYFVEKSNGVSSVRQIPITETGHIPADSWPHGFFEETLQESLALATTQAGYIAK